MTLSCTLIFDPFGRRVSIPAGTTLFQAALSKGILLRSDCGEKGTCGKCRVIVDHPDYLSPRTEQEQKLLKKRGPDHRLACQARVLKGPLRVTVPENLVLGDEVFGKTGIQGKFSIDPSVRRFPLTADQIKAIDDMTVLSREEKIRRAVEARYSETIDFKNLLPLTQLADPYVYTHDLTVVVQENNHVTAIQPGLLPTGIGIAFDIGTTTIAAYMCDLAAGTILSAKAMVNPQRRYGEDVISRISAVNDNPDALTAQQRLAAGAMNHLMDVCLEETGQSRDTIDRITVVGNTTMQHLFAGLNPHTLGTTPYLPVFQDALVPTCKDLGLHASDNVPVFIFPVISGFLGGDILAACLGDLSHTRKETSLIIDIGTNGELMLCTGNQIWATSCATGPALEGAQISSGMRAATGAVSRVWVDNGAIIHETINQAPAIGICGTGVIDILAAMRKTGTIREDGKFDPDKPGVTIDDKGTGRAFTLPGTDVRFVLKDVRQVQLAKAALSVGIQLMLEKAEVTRVDRTILTGAFGAKFDWENARDIGMLPPIICENEMIAAENLAGTGAVMALLNKTYETEIRSMARQVTFIDLASEPGFVERFSAATRFPSLD
ncbi:ASKHA domain-containing protein [Desulfotignum phosphitoxidans]|uniref:Ferredoxin n=1 Tax=Desulfotignum phosphitoxidans DSM 13687 TaxID=1286635 RepID=S0FV15_9BACT|nr:ASKHA domain-containing protein [Desulfotignum phosphitoxidans]EMS78943.1 ferredoxin [Desulfotignum phosphitoxidans DSM 13687]